MPRSRTLVRTSIVALAALLAGASAACTSDSVDAKAALEVTDVVTGWYDAGIVDGKNKLVPSISFRIKNNATEPIRGVQLNAVFRVIGDQEELGSQWVRGIDMNGLAPGASTEAFVLRSNLGYTGEQPRMQMFDHSLFKDAQVEVFAKHGSQQWVVLLKQTVQRQLLTHDKTRTS